MARAGSLPPPARPAGGGKPVTPGMIWWLGLRTVVDRR